MKERDWMLLERLVLVQDRYRRSGYHFSDHGIGNVQTAGLSVSLYASNVKCGPDKPAVAQGDLGDSVPNGRDGGCWRRDLEGKGLEISESHLIHSLYSKLRSLTQPA